MDYYRHIAGNFQQAIELISMSVDNLAQPIEHAGRVMTESLLQDRKIVACGNGADAALAQLFVCNLLNRFEQERPALPAISLGTDATALTAIATEHHIDEIFSRQLRALGQAGDVLVCISSGPSHDNLANAAQAARDLDMTVISLTTGGSDNFPDSEGVEVELVVAAERQPRVVELHAMIIHCLCEMIELNLFGSYEQD